MLRAKWFLFEHPVDAPLRDGNAQRGHMGAHMCEPPSEPPAIPLCGERGAVHVPDATASGGFILACLACLAISEVRS